MARGGNVSQFGNAPDPEMQRMNARLSSLATDATVKSGMAGTNTNMVAGMQGQASAITGMSEKITTDADARTMSSQDQANANSKLLSDEILAIAGPIKGDLLINRELIIAGFGATELLKKLNVRDLNRIGENRQGGPVDEQIQHAANFDALLAGHRLFAKGGAVGTDTVPAMLTPGEFVMKKNAVDKYGSAFMSSVNNGNVQGFSGGGPVYLHEGGSPGSAGGDIEVPSFGDVIDNFETVFQTYGDTAFLEVDKVSRAIGSASNNIAVGTKDLAAQFPAVTSALNNLGSLIGGDLSNAGSIISSSLASFTEAFSLFSGLSSMLSNTINSMADMNITHTININGSINIPGFSQESINDIINTVANEAVKNADKQIRKALRQRDRDNENRI